MSDTHATNPLPSAGKIKQPVRPKRKLWKKALILLGLLLSLALGYNAFQNWQAGIQLEARLETLRKNGEPLTLEELDSKVLPKEENALTWIRLAKPHTKELNKLLLDYMQSDEYSTFRPNAEQLKLLEDTIANHQEAFSLYARAAKCPGYQSDWRIIGPQPSESLGEHLENLQETRSIMRHCWSRASLLMAQDKYDEALKQGLQMLAISRHAESEPMVIGYLVSIACRQMSLKVITAVMERSLLDEKQRDQIDQALAACESSRGLKHALTSERIFGLASYRSHLIRIGFISIVSWKIKLEACEYLDLMESMNRLTIKSRYQIVDELNNLKNRKYAPMTTLAFSAIAQVRTAHDRALARGRAVRLLNALQRKYPEGIPEEIQPKDYPGNLKFWQDPFNGKSLIVHPSPDSIAVYSVGENGTDDGGSLDVYQDQGIQIKLQKRISQRSP